MDFNLIFDLKSPSFFSSYDSFMLTKIRMPSCYVPLARVYVITGS